MTRKNNYGMSLIEILVVVAIFAILGVIVTRSVILTITGSKKSEALVRVRENLNYSVGIIERQLRNADSVTQCPNPDPNVITFQDQLGTTTSFSCAGDYIASGSANTRLTNDSITVTNCSFVCTQASAVNPPSVTITLSAKDTNALGSQNSTVDISDKVYLRNY